MKKAKQIQISVNTLLKVTEKVLWFNARSKKNYTSISKLITYCVSRMHSLKKPVLFFDRLPIHENRTSVNIYINDKMAKIFNELCEGCGVGTFEVVESAIKHYFTDINNADNKDRKDELPF
jgi:hypothetical protein